MRQVRVGALLLLCCASAACSGTKFARSEDDPSAASGGTSAKAGAGPSFVPGGTSNAGGAVLGSGGASAGGDDSGAAGNSTGGGPAPEPCAVGSVKFTMLPSSELPQGYLCDASCGTGWLTLTDGDGASAFSIFAACGAASCGTCETTSCPAVACLPALLGHDGISFTWDGSFFAQDVCGNNQDCQRRACVPPGKYKAKACAALNGGINDAGCTPQAQPLCAEAEFDFPATEDVTLTLESY